MPPGVPLRKPEPPRRSQTLSLNPPWPTGRRTRTSHTPRQPRRPPNRRKRTGRQSRLCRRKRLPRSEPRPREPRPARRQPGPPPRAAHDGHHQVAPRQCGIDTPQAPRPEGGAENEGDGPAGRNDPGRPPSALTPHERDQLLHDDLRTEPPADRSTSGGSIAEPCVAGLRPPAGREMACRTAPSCRAVKSSSLSRW